jgi:hypothetical protein
MMIDQAVDHASALSIGFRDSSGLHVERLRRAQCRFHVRGPRRGLLHASNVIASSDERPQQPPSPPFSAPAWSRCRCPPPPWSRRRCPSSLPWFCRRRLCSLLRRTSSTAWQVVEHKGVLKRMSSSSYTMKLLPLGIMDPKERIKNRFGSVVSGASWFFAWMLFDPEYFLIHIQHMANILVIRCSV